MKLFPNSVYTQPGGLRQSEGGMLADLPEEDQDEAEMPTLPPSKDPTGQTITNPLVNKRQANSKQMVGDRGFRSYERYIL